MSTQRVPKRRLNNHTVVSQTDTAFATLLSEARMFGVGDLHAWSPGVFLTPEVNGDVYPEWYRDYEGGPRYRIPARLLKARFCPWLLHRDGVDREDDIRWFGHKNYREVFMTFARNKDWPPDDHPAWDTIEALIEAICCCAEYRAQTRRTIGRDPELDALCEELEVTKKKLIRDVVRAESTDQRLLKLREHDWEVGHLRDKICTYRVIPGPTEEPPVGLGDPTGIGGGPHVPSPYPPFSPGNTPQSPFPPIPWPGPVGPPEPPPTPPSRGPRYGPEEITPLDEFDKKRKWPLGSIGAQIRLHQIAWGLRGAGEDAYGFWDDGTFVEFPQEIQDVLEPGAADQRPCYWALYTPQGREFLSILKSIYAFYGKWPTPDNLSHEYEWMITFAMAWCCCTKAYLLSLRGGAPLGPGVLAEIQAFERLISDVVAGRAFRAREMPLHVVRKHYRQCCNLPAPTAVVPLTGPTGVTQNGYPMEGMSIADIAGVTPRIPCPDCRFCLRWVDQAVFETELRRGRMQDAGDVYRMKRSGRSSCLGSRMATDIRGNIIWPGGDSAMFLCASINCDGFALLQDCCSWPPPFLHLTLNVGGKKYEFPVNTSGAAGSSVFGGNDCDANGACVEIPPQLGRRFTFSISGFPPGQETFDVHDIQQPDY